MVVKNEKPRRGILSEKLQLYSYFVDRKTLNRKQNNWICDKSTKDFLIDRKIYHFLIHSETFFHDYDVATLENIHPIIFRKYTKHPIKVFFKILG